MTEKQPLIFGDFSNPIKPPSPPKADSNMNQTKYVE